MLTIALTRCSANTRCTMARRILTCLAPILLAVILVIPGCAPSTSSTSTYDPAEIAEVFSPSTEGDPAQRIGWSIAIATFSQANHEAAAAQVRDTLAAVHGLRDAWIDTEEDHTILFFGRYPSRQEAAGELERIRHIRIDNRQPFILAFLVPPSSEMPALGNPAYSLGHVRELHGEGVRLYTVEVGVYDDPDRELAMRSAEEAVAVYRRNGEQAFFYHGPHRSSVTIGVLEDSQVDLSAPGFGPLVRELRLRHPYRAVNGKRIRIKEMGKDRGLAPSRLMLVP
ncbi:MAG: hypothetical protein KAS72_08440 [Phycisphaerales bacterium]|nr:hypothetical protein [Phycisphaerales bacterium]